MNALSYVRRVAGRRLPRSGHEGGIDVEGTSGASDTATENPRTWDVRSVRYVDAVTAPLIVGKLLDADSAIRSGGQPIVTRIGPPVSFPWLGTLRVTQIPVCVTAPHGAAVGYVEVMPVGAGAVEVRVCLIGQARLHRPRAWRRLRDLAEQVGDQIVHQPGATGATIPQQRAAPAAESVSKTPRA